MDKKYQAFLKEVEKNVDKYVDLEAEFQKNHEPASDVIFDVLGPEFREDEIVSKWGREVYERACSEVPNMEGQEGEEFPLKDFSKATRKLGVFFQEGIRASFLVDFDDLIQKYEAIGFPCYLDYENNILHCNAKNKTFGGK